MSNNTPRFQPAWFKGTRYQPPRKGQTKPRQYFVATDKMGDAVDMLFVPGGCESTGLKVRDGLTFQVDLDVMAKRVVIRSAIDIPRVHLMISSLWT